VLSNVIHIQSYQNLCRFRCGDAAGPSCSQRMRTCQPRTAWGIRLAGSEEKRSPLTFFPLPPAGGERSSWLHCFKQFCSPAFQTLSLRCIELVEMHCLELAERSKGRVGKQGLQQKSEMFLPCKIFSPSMPVRLPAEGRMKRGGGIWVLTPC